MKRFILFLGVVSVVLLAYRAEAATTEYWFKAGSSDFSQAASYYTDAKRTKASTTAPDADDIVHLPPGTYNLTFGTDSCNRFLNLQQVRFEVDTNTVINVTVGAGETAEMNSTLIPETYAQQNFRFCTLVKKGMGDLKLMRGDVCIVNSEWKYTLNYNCSQTVEEGAIWLCPNPGLLSHNVGMITINKGATYYVPGKDGDSNKYSFSPRGLSGAGTLKNNFDSKCQLYMLMFNLPETKDCDFSGNMTGKISLQVSGPARFSGINSDNDSGDDNVFFVSGVRDDEAGLGWTWIKKFGKVGYASSIGKQDVVMQENGAMVEYTGSGETAMKSIILNSPWTNHYDTVLSGGAYGGLEFGYIDNSQTAIKYTINNTRYPNAAYPQQFNAQITFTGSNATPCRVGMPVMPNTSYGKHPGINMRKQGTGTWIFEGAAKKSENYAGWTIEDGVLGTDSYADALEYCSLGLGGNYGSEMNLRKYVGDSGSNESVFFQPTPYAIEMGCTNGEGRAVLEYTGTNTWGGTTRLIGVKGKAGFRNNGKGRIFIGNVTPVKNEEVTVTLDGASTTENCMQWLTNGVGKIALVKEGTGTWRLKCDNRVDSLSVMGGTLIVDNNYHEEYRYFRLWLQEAYDSSRFIPSFYELALFGDDGLRYNVGMKFYCSEGSEAPVAPVDSEGVYNARSVFRGGYYDLEPNEIAYGAKNESTRITWYAGGSKTDYRDLGNVTQNGYTPTFYNWGSTSSGFYLTRYGNLKTTAGYTPTYAKGKDGWIPIVMRIREDAPRITSIDFVGNATASLNDALPRAWLLEGSADGKNFEEAYRFYSTSTPVTTTDKHRWFSDGAIYQDGETSLRVGKGYRFAGVETNQYAFAITGSKPLALGGGGKLKFQGNNTIEFSDIKLDAAGGATLEGAKLAENGTLEIYNVGDQDPVAIPGSFAEATGWENLADPEKWNVTVKMASGETSRVHILAVADGKLTLRKQGAFVIIR